MQDRIKRTESVLEELGPLRRQLRPLEAEQVGIFAAAGWSLARPAYRRGSELNTGLPPHCPHGRIRRACPAGSAADPFLLPRELREQLKAGELKCEPERQPCDPGSVMFDGVCHM